MYVQVELFPLILKKKKNFYVGILLYLVPACGDVGKQRLDA